MHPDIQVYANKKLGFAKWKAVFERPARVVVVDLFDPYLYCVYNTSLVLVFISVSIRNMTSPADT